MAALFTLGFLGTHPQPAAVPHQDNAQAQVIQQSRSKRLEQERKQITAINDFGRQLRGGHTHKPATVAQRKHSPAS